MNRDWILFVLGWTIVLIQMWVQVYGTSPEDVWKRAKRYNQISRKLESLVDAEKALNRQYLQEKSEKWFQTWEIEVHRSAVYPGYLGCNPDQVMHAISLIRSKLERDALSCMDNIIAEQEDLTNRTAQVAREAEEVAKLSEEVAGLKEQHFDALLECLPDPTEVGNDEKTLKWAPRYIRDIARFAPMLITHWKTFEKSFMRPRKACIDFHAMEQHGTTADIVYLFEECVRGDMTDWVHGESTDAEIQSLFKIILRDAYTRPAQFIRSLTSMFDNNAQLSITAVRKSHVAQAAELAAYYESRSHTDLTSPCSRYLPQLKSSYSKLIAETYQCLHGTYMNFLEAKKLIELDAHDINRLTTNSTYLMDLQRHNISIDELGHQIKTKVLPTYDTARKKDFQMQDQYENDAQNIKTHLERAFVCVKDIKRDMDKISLELSRNYVKCPRKEAKRRLQLEKLETDHLMNVLQRTDDEHNDALFHTLQRLEKWRKQERHRTVSSETTPVCQTPCAAKAIAEINKLRDDGRADCVWEHLKTARLQMKKGFEQEIHLRDFIRDGRDGQGTKTVKQCLQNAVLTSRQASEKLRTKRESCGSNFVDSWNDQTDSILSEFWSCFTWKCSRTWRYIVRSWGIID